MKLEQLIAVLDQREVRGPQDMEVHDIVYDSRRVQPGDLFVAVRGEHTDGHRYIASADEKGAVAVVVDREDVHGTGTTIRVSDSRKALALLSAQWYGRPADRLRLLGITGTDGKTTTSFLLRSLLQSAGYQVGLIGTVITSFGEKELPSQYTTPEALELHGMMAQMVSQGSDFVVMEVSSHALALDRVLGIPFEMGIFTNLSRDHLDFHGDFQHYREAKASLFQRLQGPKARAVINLDDPHAQFMMDRTEVPIITFSMEGKADVSLSRATLTTEASEIEASTPQGPIHFRSHLLGRYNVINALAAMAAGIALELPREVIRAGLERVNGVDGRFETVETGRGFSVIIDYAHTPQALARLLSAIRELSPGRVLVVFGCGGDRDRGKRSQMGSLATKMADVVILTTDNPRSEEPLEILREVEQGVTPGSTYEVVPDRRQAIRRGLILAQPGDVLAVAGRGHEQSQIFADQRIPFLDRSVILEELDRLKAENY
jgi:UDP-N-acetylmuramoyl-L-alanyl-D-glutamate--2,6-diaminopimelate ligase